MHPAFALAIPLAALALASAPPVRGSSSVGLALLAEAQVDREGVFLSQLVAAPLNPALPHLHLLPAPPLGTPTLLTRTRLQELLAQSQPALTVTQWTGADRIRISRRTRPLPETELRDWLAATLQASAVGDRGELELRLSRPWTPALIPDEPLSLRLLDLPASGLSPLLLLRFELLAGTESVGSWQVLLQLRIWREIWVVRSPLRRGQLLDPADLQLERRDVLPLREPLADLARTDAAIEITEGLQAGAPLYQRHLRLRPVVRRGQTANAILQEGALQLVLRVEVLEDGAPGQIIRLRNPVSRREFKGKVHNETTLLIGS